ncbi:MAG: hypothetical protein IPM47_11960 [Sphingobacteriales bacterium]|nr:MAG: hypothetical protein IPM47_11960 [Sphingobacteriales bacterium]
MKNYTKEQVESVVKIADNFLAEINEAVKWAEAFLKPELAKHSSEKLKSIRREVNRLHYALVENPSAALYGLSQVGKSYLIKNLLSIEGQPLWITDQSTGKKYDFLKDINPKGDKVEATSMVTRFTTNSELPNKEYSIKMKLLSPKDIILILCDTYYRDLTSHSNLPTSDDIASYLETTLSYIKSSTEKQDYLSEDDVMEIKEYLSTNFPDKCRDIIHSGFWQITAAGINKLGVDKWNMVFHILWCKNEYISNIFNALINELHKIKFAKIIYAEFRSILRTHGTILHVDRLKELGEEPVFADVSKSDWLPDVQFFEPNSNKTFSIRKNHLCSLIEELVLPLDQELEKTKSFLSHSDLLDFPGARGRLTNIEAKIGKEHIGQMVLRGKVSYIFNRYSRLNLVMNLLFCNNDEQIATSEISVLLNSWISEYIGQLPEERTAFLKDTELPPLFVIYTFFNRDLTFNSINDNENSLSSKWTKRFVTIFEDEIVTKNFDWHKNWSLESPFFKNNYLLRDFEYSNQIYSGYVTHGKEVALIPPPQMPDYFPKLKQSFLKHEFVKNYFDNPEEMWKESAELNKDGSELIIKNLNRVSGNIARINKFVRRLRKLKKEFHKEMNKHYHSEKASENIRKAGEQAGKIKLDMDICFTRNPYAFGRFIKAFLIDEAEIYNFLKDKINDLIFIENNNLQAYTLIRSRLGSTIDKSYEDNLNTLTKVYHLGSLEEAELKMKNQGIDLQVLFYGDEVIDSIKNNATLLADALRDLWFKKYLKKDNFHEVLGIGFSEDSLGSLLNNIEETYKNLRISERIANNLREFVDNYDSSDKAEEMIADMSAAIINNFITQMGWGFYSDELVEKIKETNEKDKLNLEFSSTEPLETAGNEDLSDLFDLMSRYDEEICKVNLNRETLQKYPNIYNIKKWQDLMHISFIANCDIPNYDLLGNERLGQLLQKIQNVVFDNDIAPM